MPDPVTRITVSDEHLRHCGVCGWCGRRNVMRRYAVYRRGRDMYTAEICDRCLEECRRGMEWTNREGGTGCRS